ncbi:MAG: putative serine/threonine-protein kinase ATG1a [Streblomastix strix]|uniref:Putative serine/threonine-protein kinase ATG1a n=1 Tax=Streblomastix strix TaxID=222440 RepID=A0A5J4WQS8_9EUKA|nr:MAG: putative serine/threonine-protein kinase ATG1a [Streblomastix strix]
MDAQKIKDKQFLTRNNFMIVKDLGAGAYGRVYLAHHQDFGIVAAKIVDSDKFDYSEWEASGKLKEAACPFIVKFIAANEFQEKLVVILMEYANAKSLQTIMDDYSRDITMPSYRALAKQLLEGIRAVHDAKLIHRDIKPENIMLNSEYGNTQVKIVDFGLVKFNDHGIIDMSIAGTPFYSSPELLFGNQDKNNKIDMWSVGCVLYQLAYHKLPIAHETHEKFLQNLRDRRIEQPSHIKDNLLHNLLMNLLDFNPITRLSAQKALQHQFFTSQDAQSQITTEAYQIAQNVLQSKQNGNIQITQFDYDQTYICPTSEIMTFLKMNPESELQQIYSSYQQNHSSSSSSSPSIQQLLQQQSPIIQNPQLNQLNQSPHVIYSPNSNQSPLTQQPSQVLQSYLLRPIPQINLIHKQEIKPSYDLLENPDTICPKNNILFMDLEDDNLTIYCCTWNLQGKLPSEEMLQFLPLGNYDVYAIATQECQRSIAV